MTCEILSVGTELLLGTIANTDARIISRGLSSVGIACYRHTVVGDNPERLRAAVLEATARADLIITTGGLGPTCDDLTKQIICEAFGIPLELHEPTRARIYDFFRKRGKEPTPNNLQQAMVPVGGVVLQNDWGTAPGVGIETDTCRIYMLPGPPSECEPLFEKILLPLLRQSSDRVFVSRDVRIVGLGEAVVESMLPKALFDNPNPSLAPYAGEAEVLLRVTAAAPTPAAAAALCAPVVQQLRAALGDNIYGIDVPDLPSVLVRLLREQGKTIAFAESCTGGKAAALLTAVPGSSTCFKGGVVAYTPETKQDLLRVPAAVIETHGVVSPQVAAAMAVGCAAVFDADYAVGITGYAGPEGNPAGRVCLCLADASGAVLAQIDSDFGDERERVRIHAAKTALDMIRRQLTIA